MSWTLTTSGAVLLKAGTEANSIKTSGAVMLQTSDEVESMLCAIGRYDFVTNYSSLTTNGKQILGNLASNMIAQKVISYDLAAYPTMREAETMLDVIENDIRRGIQLIEDDNVKTYLGAT